MSHWHADINATALTSGASLTVLSQHHVVRLAVADTLAIDTTSGHCLSAVVLDRTDASITLDVGDAHVSLAMLVDESLLPPGENRLAFSRQVWLAQ